MSCQLSVRQCEATFGSNIQDARQPQGSHVLEIARLRKATAVDSRHNFCKVDN